MPNLVEDEVERSSVFLLPVAVGVAGLAQGHAARLLAQELTQAGVLQKEALQLVGPVLVVLVTDLPTRA